MRILIMGFKKLTIHGGLIMNDELQDAIDHLLECVKEDSGYSKEYIESLRKRIIDELI